jgi:hypothetical protein
MKRREKFRELLSLLRQQTELLRREVFGGLSAQENREYENRAEKIRQVENELDISEHSKPTRS